MLTSNIYLKYKYFQLREFSELDVVPECLIVLAVFTIQTFVQCIAEPL